MPLRRIPVSGAILLVGYFLAALCDPASARHGPRGKSQRQAQAHHTRVATPLGHASGPKRSARRQMHRHRYAAQPFPFRQRVAGSRALRSAFKLPPDIMAEAMPLPPPPESESDRQIREARAYLMATVKPGVTMSRLGPVEAIAKLHPVFVVRLAAAIREARASGLPRAGCYSAFRPPALGVGGWRDKFDSLHAYGLACDIDGIGRPGSEQADLWYRIATKHQLYNPFFGTNIWWEWQHYQPTGIAAVTADMPLRATITADGPVDLARTWAAAQELIDLPVPSAEDAEATLPGFARTHRASPPLALPRYRGQARAASRHHRWRSKTSALRGSVPSPALARGRSKASIAAKPRLKRRYVHVSDSRPH